MADGLLHIEGSVENVIYRNESNGYIVLDLDASGELITVVGVLGNIEEGEILILEGNYSSHKKYGTQFTAEYCERKLPDDTVNIEKYLASGAIKGIGAVLARKIVHVFGEDTLDIIENNPQRLCEIKGIPPKKCKEITDKAKKIFSLRTLASYLAQYEVKAKYAMSLHRKYGNDVMELIKKNPYIMCGDGIGLDFRKADTIAHDLSIAKNADCRIIAGVQYVLSVNALNGHSCLPVESLMKVVMPKLDISEKDFFNSYNRAVDDGELFSYIKNDREYVYLPDYYYAESFIADRLKVLCGFSSPENFSCDQLIDIEEQENSIKYEGKQRTAIATAISRNIMVLTGSPGTGKTTTLNAIISILEKKGDKVLLAAPTGRAAKRMTELTGHEAKTIHRLLEVAYSADNRLVFVRNENNPLDCDALIIDEMSMVDCLLFAELLRALRLNCKLIMTGDFHQLSSVGAGNLLEDIINSGTVPIVELTEIFRQAQKSYIITNAHKIISGEYPDVSKNKNDFFFFPLSDHQKAAQFIVYLTKVRLPNYYKYSPADDIQIITPSHKGTVGTIEMNRMLQEHINPPDESKAEYRIFGKVYRTGDKVMQMQNNYDILWTKNSEQGTGIFNGDIGKIVSIDSSSQTALIDFDGRRAVYPFETLAQIELAYAITVHKSQGCEFDAVIMPVMDGFDKLCYRNLLYTAVTRAKKLLILVGSEEKIRSMIDNNKRTRRYTCLRDMLDRKENNNG